jgi:hypothetical protein
VEEPRVCDFQLPLTSRETFDGADADTKLKYLFDISCTALQNQNKVIQYIQAERKRDRKITFGISSGVGAGVSAVALLLKELFAFFRL